MKEFDWWISLHFENSILHQDSVLQNTLRIILQIIRIFKGYLSYGNYPQNVLKICLNIFSGKPKKLDLKNLSDNPENVLQYSGEFFRKKFYSIMVSKEMIDRRDAWSCVYGRRLMFWRSWVRIPALYNGCTFFHI